MTNKKMATKFVIKKRSSKMEVPINFKGLLVSLVLVILMITTIANQCKAAVDEKQDLEAAKIVFEENRELSEEQLGSIIRDFGLHIKETMQDEMGKLFDNVKMSSKKGRLNADEFERFKDANQAVSEDAQLRIELAAKKNNGELTQSSADGSGGKSSFMSQVSGRLRSAGSFIGQQMSSLAAYAPRIKDKLKKIPDKLRKLLQWPNFLRYKIRFNKAYKSLREELYRQMVYLHTQTIVGVQNLKYLTGSQSHLLRATQFADMTTQEFQRIYANADAEGASGMDIGEKLDSADLKHLQELAQKGRDIFGNEVITRERPAAATKQQQQQQSRRRRKRSLPEAHEQQVDDEHNELDDEEEDSDEDDLMQDAEDGGPEPIKNELDDDSRLVDEFAAEFSDDARTEDAADLEDLMDEVLDEVGHKLKPIDLRDSECIPNVENQNGCGACYAYATTMVFAYFNCMKKQPRALQRFNPRFISDCGRYMYPEGVRSHLNGCVSGKLSHAFSFARDAGHYPFMKYEVARVSFNYSSDQCAFPRPPSTDTWAPVTLPWFKRVKLVYLPDQQSVDVHLRTIGPVLVNIRTWKNFENQGYGAYNEFEESSNPIIHSMVIVAHDVDQQGRDFFVIWNSFGINWAEHGYLRVYAKSLDYFKVLYAGFIDMDTHNL